MISGATMSRKKKFIHRILRSAKGAFEIPPQKLIYCYNQYQPLFDNMEQTIPNLLLYQGLPSRDQIEEWTEAVKHKVLILEDLMTQVAKSTQISSPPIGASVSNETLELNPNLW